MLCYQYNFVVKMLAQVAEFNKIMYNSMTVTKQRTWYIHLWHSILEVGIIQIQC